MPARASDWPHRLATIVAAATLGLIFLGGRVTSTGSGMAVSDWPTHQGYWFLPFARWVGPVGIETSHRVAGQIVGVLTIALAAVSWKLGEGRARWLGGVALILVIGQGILGALRVVEIDPRLAPVHGCAAQLVFAFLAALVVLTSRPWGETAPSPSPHAKRLLALAWLLVGAAYLQVVLGALYRHAIVFTLVPHAAFALVVLGLGVAATVALKRAHPDAAFARRAGKLVHAALGTQVLLGLGLWALKRGVLEGSVSGETAVDVNVAFASLHLVAGALVLGTSVGLALAVGRSLVPVSEAAAPSPAEAPQLAGGVS